MMGDLNRKSAPQAFCTISPFPETEIFPPSPCLSFSLQGIYGQLFYFLLFAFAKAYRRLVKTAGVVGFLSEICTMVWLLYLYVIPFRKTKLTCWSFFFSFRSSFRYFFIHLLLKDFHQFIRVNMKITLEESMIFLHSFPFLCLLPWLVPHNETDRQCIFYDRATLSLGTSSLIQYLKMFPRKKGMYSVW